MLGTRDRPHLDRGSCLELVRGRDERACDQQPADLRQRHAESFDDVAERGGAVVPYLDLRPTVARHDEQPQLAG